MKVRALAILTSIVFLLCFFSACWAQQVCRPGMPCYQGPQTYQAPQYQQSTRPATFCDLIVKVQDTNGMSTGSGTPVMKHQGKTVVLTNWHVVQERASDTSVTVYRPNSPPASARVLEADKDLDVAVVLVDADWPVVNIGTELDTSAALQTRGHAHGTSFRVYQGRVTSRIARGYFVSSPSISGMSGGGVFQNQQYVGIIWGGADSYCAITSIRHIRPFLNRVLGRQVIEVQTDLVPVEAPPREPNLPPPACPDCQQSCGCDEKISKLVDLQAELVEVTSKLETMIVRNEADVEFLRAIQEGNTAEIVSLKEQLAKIPAGKDGEDGVDGKDGRNGKDATIDEDALAERITLAVLERIDLPTPEPTSVKHYVLVADSAGDYWKRLSDEYTTAKAAYSQIKLAPPPSFPVGTLPQMVEYQSGVPQRTIFGSRAVSEALALLARGETL